MILWIVIGGAAAFCILTVLLCHRYVKSAFDIIEASLDQILNKKAILPSGKLGEDRISKLNHKVHRIMDMYISEAALNQKEKETIQGFISDMSHQMKTPLSGISMYSELLLSENLSDVDRREFTSRIQGLSNKLQWMMDGLIKMSRLEVGAIELVPANGDIRQTILNAIQSTIAGAIKKNINIIVEDFENTLLYHDKKWTAEAIANILENAVKYSPSDSEIKISLEPLSLYTKITICNFGTGIPKEEYNLIFKRFYRGQNAQESEGAGLGLYLASIIMEKQGGYIMVDSKSNEFTSFSLFLQNCKN